MAMNVNHSTHTPTVAKAMRAQFAIDAAMAGKLRVGSDIQDYAASAGVLLVDPINADPFVIVGNYDQSGNARFERFVTHVFSPANPQSGVDAMRARIAAKSFFNSIAVRGVPAPTDGN